MFRRRFSWYCSYPLSDVERRSRVCTTFCYFSEIFIGFHFFKSESSSSNNIYLLRKIFMWLICNGDVLNRYRNKILLSNCTLVFVVATVKGQSVCRNLSSLQRVSLKWVRDIKKRCKKSRQSAFKVFEKILYLHDSGAGVKTTLFRRNTLYCSYV